MYAMRLRKDARVGGDLTKQLATFPATSMKVKSPALTSLNWHESKPQSCDCRTAIVIRTRRGFQNLLLSVCSLVRVCRHLCAKVLPHVQKCPGEWAEPLATATTGSPNLGQTGSNLPLMHTSSLSTPRS